MSGMARDERVFAFMEPILSSCGSHRGEPLPHFNILCSSIVAHFHKGNSPSTAMATVMEAKF